MSYQSQYVPAVSPDAQSYARFLQKMGAKYPTLMNLEHELRKFDRHCRVRLIDFPRSPESCEFHTLQELNEYLDKPEPGPLAPRCRVYVLENLTLEYIAIFGHHFNVDPTVFAEQAQRMNWADFPNENYTPKLHLRRDPNRSFTLRYSELRLFAESVAGLKLVDSSAGRVVTVTTRANHLSRFHRVGIVRRCISFWCTKIKKDGWEGN